MGAIEKKARYWSCALFFCLMFGYYAMRPLRDDIGVHLGARALRWTFSATFGVLLLITSAFSYLVSKWDRTTAVVSVFVAPATLIAILAAWPSSPQRDYTFFIFVGALNFFLVSVFWSLIADTFSSTTAKRHYSLIAASGTAGALMGPGVAAICAYLNVARSLLWLSSGLLLVSAFCVTRIKHPSSLDCSPGRLGGRFTDGVRQIYHSRFLLRILAFVLIGSLVSTVVYLEQVKILSSFGTFTDRTRLFALMDLCANLSALALQLLATRYLIARIGIGGILLTAMVVNAGGLAVLLTIPSVTALIVVQTLRRSSDLALIRPGKEALFTIVTAAEKYKAKNFLETVVYRATDSGTAWAAGSVNEVHGSSIPAMIAIPLALVAAILGWRMGNTFSAGQDGLQSLNHAVRRENESN